MNATGKTIAQNASALMASQLLTWGLTLLLLLFLPRYLGPTAVGQFHFANSLWAIAAILITFGTDRHLTKEIARMPRRAEELFAITAAAQTLLYFVGFGAVAVYLNAVGYAPETVQVVLVIGLGQLLWQWVGSATAVLQGLEQMRYIAIGSVLGKLFNTSVAILLLLLGYGVLTIAAVTIGAGLVNCLALLIYLRRFIPIRLNFNLGAMRLLLYASVSYLFVRFALVFYQQADIIIISLLVDEATIGWYGVANQLFGTLLFIPTVFMTAVFPALSRLYATDTSGLNRLAGKSFDLLLILSVPLGLGLVAMATPLTLLLFGDLFAPSGPTLAIFGIVLIFTYQNMLIGQFLISVDRQNRWTAVMVAATVATIPLDLLLIPWCAAQFGNGALGGALAFVVTETGMLIAGLLLLPSGILTRRNGWLALRVALAGLLMLAVAWPMRYLFLPLPIITGAIVYLAAIWLLRVVGAEEAAILRASLRQARARLRGGNK